MVAMILFLFFFYSVSKLFLYKSILALVIKRNYRDEEEKRDRDSIEML